MDIEESMSRHAPKTRCEIPGRPFNFLNSIFIVLILNKRTKCWVC